MEKKSKLKTVEVAIFDDDVLAGVWDLSPPDRGWDEVAQDVMEQRGW